MNLFSKKVDYISLLNDIKNIEFSNDNIDSKSSAEKLELLRILKIKIEKSGILDSKNNDASRLLIKDVYNLLYTKQGDFSNSYYFSLSHSLKTAGSYIDTIKPYEIFLSQKISSLTNLANEINSSKSKKLVPILSLNTGLLRKTMFAIIIALSAMSCTFSFKKNFVIPYVKDGIFYEYAVNMYDFETYAIRNGKKLKFLELGTIIVNASGTFDLYTGGKENGSIQIHSINNDAFADVMVIKREDDSIVEIAVNKKSPSHDKLIKGLGSYIVPFNP